MNHFSQTLASQMANEISMGLHGKPVDDLDTDSKIILLGQAAKIEREELMACIISMLHPDLRLEASRQYERAIQ